MMLLKTKTKKSPNWKSLIPGRVIRIESTVLHEYSAGQQEQVACKVVSIKDITSRLKIYSYRLFELQDIETEEFFWLCVDFSLDEPYIKVLMESDFFADGGRQDQINWNNHWLFQQPEDPDDFGIEDLAYAKTFKKGDFTYMQHKELACTISYLPADRKPEPGILIEYSTIEKGCPVPEIMILETGKKDNSVISLYEGWDVNVN